MSSTILVIVCGGNSERMGTDKYLLNYHGSPQFLHLTKILSPYFNDIRYSIQEKQIPAFNNYKNTIVDLPPYSGHGPISGLLSSFEILKDHSILFIGCDYPLIDADDLLKLVNKENRTSAYFDKYYEPLLAFYSANDHLVLKSEFSNGNFSLNKFLDKINARKIISDHPERLKSVDTRTDYDQIKALLNRIV